MINDDFKSIQEVLTAFPDEQTCILHLENLRWNGIVISPFDPNSTVYSCKNNRYRCKNTGKYFNAKTNTLFYNSRIELQKWFVAIWLVTSKEKFISSVALSNELKITQKSAWFMLKNIKNYFDIAIDEETNFKKTKRKKRVQKNLEEIDVIVETDKLQMTDWLKLLKK